MATPRVAVVCCLAVLLHGTASGEDRYLTGARPGIPPGAEWQPKVIKERRDAKAPLPVRHKNITYLPRVGRQSLPNCGAFAPSYYYKTWQEAKEHGWVRPDPGTHPERVMSTGFTFPLSNVGFNDGAYISAAMQAICDCGIAPLSIIPESWDFSTYPPESVWRAALPYRGNDWGVIETHTETGLEAVKEHLVGGDLAVFAMWVYHDTHVVYPKGAGVSNGVLVEVGDSPWDSHAFTLIGYDDEKAYEVNGEERRGAFLAVNSWGPDWGVFDEDADEGGFIWFSYEYFKNPDFGARGAYIMTDRIGYQPTQVAVMHASFDRRNRVGFGAYPGSPSRPMATGFGPQRFASGRLPYLGTLVFDATDYAGVGSGHSFTLGVFEDSSLLEIVPHGTESGRIMSFHIERADGQKIEAPLPAEGVPILSGERLFVHAGPFKPVSLGESFDALNDKGVRMSWCDWSRDGVPDLTVVGSYLNASSMTRLYRGMGQGELQLSATAIELPGVTQGQLAWADFDMDGMPDLAIAGLDSTNSPVLRIHQNIAARFFPDFNWPSLEALREPRLAAGDYNNDGRPDLIISGYDTAGTPKTILYRNDRTQGRLVPAGIALPASAREGLSLVDMDNDGLLDLAIGPVLMRNTGNGFVQAGLLDAGQWSEHAWADHDNDGDADLAYSFFDGNGETPEESVRTLLYRNDGAFHFTPMVVPFQGVHSPAMTWCDFDSDGMLDLVLSGTPIGWFEKKATRLYRQKSVGLFEEVAPDVPDLGDGSITWPDLNGDGAPDMVLSGVLPFDGTPPLKARSAAYLSRLGSGGYPGRPNTAPVAPLGLSILQRDDTGAVELRWDPAVDGETPQAGLRYQVSVDHVIANQPALAELPLPHGGNSLPPQRLAGNQPGRLLRDLTPGVYWWRVRAVDGGGLASPWSLPHEFTMGGGGLADPDVGKDQIVDAADRMSVARVLAGANPGSSPAMDLDGDGVVTALDGRLIVDRLLARQGAGETTVATAIIGSGGGTISSPEFGIAVDVPAGAFPTATRIAIEATTRRNDYGAGILPLSWSVSGLPWDYREPLKLRLQDRRPSPGGDPYIALGSHGHATSDAGERWSFAKKRLRPRQDGWFETAVQPPDRASSRGNQKQPANYGFTIQIYMLGRTQYQYAGGNFTITGGEEVRDKLPVLAGHLEDALALFRNDLGFNVDKRDWATYPVEVTVADLGATADGTPNEAFAYAGWGYNSMGIELSPDLLLHLDDNHVRRTASHELFHLMQFFYDPRNALSRRGRPPQLWWNEATATYVESLVLDEDPYVPGTLTNNYLATFGGYDPNGLDGPYGYAMANFARHFVDRNGGPAALLRTYERILAGEDALLAIHRSDSGYPNSSLFATFFQRVTMNELYPVPQQILTLKRYVAKAPRDLVLSNPAVHRGVSFPEVGLGFLGASYGFISFQPPYLNVTAEDKVGFQVVGGNDAFSMMTVLSYTPSTGTFETLGSATLDAATGRRRLVLSNAPAHVRHDHWLIPLVSGHTIAALGTPPDPTRVTFGVFRDYASRPIESHNVYTARRFYQDTRLEWPVFRCSGEFAAEGVSHLAEHYKEQVSAEASTPGITLQFWASPVKPARINYRADYLADSHIQTAYDPFLDAIVNVTLTRTPGTGLRYRLHKSRFQMEGEIFSDILLSTSAWQDTGEFNLDYNLDDVGFYINWSIEVEFTYTETVRLGSAVVKTGTYTGRISPWFTYGVAR